LRHAKDESKRDLAEVYKSGANSLNVNGNFADLELVGRVVYNEVHKMQAASVVLCPSLALITASMSKAPEFDS
jgi:hypothetical protein